MVLGIEEAIKILVYIHAFFGGVGLITGIGNLILKKGTPLHKKIGKIFSYSMIISSLISLVVAKMPNHENLFLFLIGIFTIYLVLAGNRALTLNGKSKEKANYIDKSISGIMFSISIIMVVIGTIGIIQKIDNHILYVLFGGFGFLLSISDFKTFKTFKENKTAALKSHIGRMIGALIASVTAFIVAGLHIGNILAWILPTIIGTGYIIYWTRKLKVVAHKG